MILQLYITGPGIDTFRRIRPGQPPLTLGRDLDCAVCLPDPQRNVSRRHLSVWNDGGELHFHVLSIVNGIEMPFGEAPPGARGVLPAGQVLKLGEYNVTAEPVEGADPDDPWSVFESEASETGATRPVPLPHAESDPFDWGFDTFGPPEVQVGGAALQAGKLGVARDLAPFFRGLGFDAVDMGALSEGELESIGQMVREAVLGLRTLHGLTQSAKNDLSAEDRTMLAEPRTSNPMQENWPDEVLMKYLFGGRAAGIGFLAPERAVRDAVAQLCLHETATRGAVRALAEGLLREFDPEALKRRLLGSGGRLFESARAWDAYARHYEEQKQDLHAWVERVLGKYFTEAYVRESVRSRRGPRSSGS